MKRLVLGLLLLASPAFAQTYNAQGELLSACRLTDGVDYIDISSSGAISSKIIDGTAAGQVDVIGPAPTGTEQGMVTRNIPSGTQPVSGTVGVSGTVPVSGPLTDAQLRGTPVPVSGTVNATGPLTNTELRASPVPVTVSGGGSSAVDATIVSPLSTAAPATTASAVTVRQALTNRTSSGTLGALNAAVSLVADGLGAVGFEVDSGLVGTVLLEATIDGTNWWTVEAYDLPNKDTQTSIVSGDLPFRGRSTVVAVAQLRLRVSAYTSGSSAARMLGSLGAATAGASSGGGGGALSQVEGAAADGSPVSGNPVMMGAEAMNDGTTPSSVSAGAATRLLATTDGRLLVSNDHPRRIRCTVVNNSATTIQAFGGDCIAPGTGLTIYVTGISFSVSTTATGTANQYMQIVTGSGGTCGTNQAIMWALHHVAMSPVSDNIQPPLRVTPINGEICWFDAVTGNKTINIRGYIAP